MGAFGARHPLEVERGSSSFFCVLRAKNVTAIAPLLAALLTVVAIGYEVAIVLHLFRDWKGFRTNPSGVPMNFLVRIGIFTFVAVLCVIVAITFLAHIESPLPNLFLSFLPMAAFIIFGTQSDILQALMFWRKDDEEEDEAPMVRQPSRSSSTDDVPREKEPIE